MSFVLLFCAAFASAHPSQTEEAEALRRDLMSIVAIAEQQVWTIDRYEIDELIPKALVCVCRSVPQVQTEALRLLKREINSMGGPVENAWKAADKDLSEIPLLVTLDRTAKLLERAIQSGAQDCPYHIEPEVPYIERNRAPNRLFISTEGGGLLNTRFVNDEVLAGGGGSPFHARLWPIP